MAKIAKISFWCLAALALVISVVYIYYHFNKTNYTIGTNYLGDQAPVDLIEFEDKLTEVQKNEYEKRVLFDINVYSNSNNSGIKLNELMLNYFTDTSLSTSVCRSSGIQYAGDLVEDIQKLDDTDISNIQNSILEINNKFYEYERTQSISWNGGKNLATGLSRDEKYTIKIDDKPYQLQLTGSYEYVSSKFLWIEKKETHYYTFLEVLYDCVQAVKTNSKGYGDGYIVVDLSKYFSVYEFNERTGQFREQPTTDIVKNYATLKFHYDEKGASMANQSIFGIIAEDSKYGMPETPVDYWKAEFNFDLTEDDLDFRTSEVYNGELAFLNLKKIELYENSKVNITIDLSQKAIKGLDISAFENLKINSLTIIGSNQDFYLLENSLKNTGLMQIKISSGVNLIKDNCSDFELEEVQL